MYPNEILIPTFSWRNKSHLSTWSCQSKTIYTLSENALAKASYEVNLS